MRRVLFAACVVAATSIVWVGGSSSTVSAHAALESSTPAANSVLEEGPPLIVLDFDEAIESSLSSVTLYGGDNQPIAVGVPAPGADDTAVTVSVPALDDDIYAVIWRVVSADGHAVDGAFTFKVGTSVDGDGEALLAAIGGGSKAAPEVRWVYAAARFLSVGGAIVLLGLGGWTFLGPGELARRRGVRRTVIISWAALLVGSAAAFGLFGAQAVAGDLGDAVSPNVWGDIVTSQTGRMLVLRVVLAVAIGGLLVVAAQRSAGWWRGAASAAGALTLVTFPAAGHANALDPRVGWIAVDTAHLTGITVWVGGLAALVLSGRALLREPPGERLARRFSKAAFVAVPVIVVTGVMQTFRLAGGLDDLTATGWGRLLLTKVTVVVMLLAIAGVSRWLLLHDGAGSIHRTVVVESVLAVMAIGLAAGMVGLAPKVPPAAQAFSEQLSSNGLIAELSVSPGRVGTNEMHVVITPPGGSIEPVASATARMSLPSASVPLAPIELVRDGPNHYTGQVEIPRSGDWTFELVIQVTESDTVLLSATVPIP